MFLVAFSIKVSFHCIVQNRISVLTSLNLYFPMSEVGIKAEVISKFTVSISEVIYVSHSEQGWVYRSCLVNVSFSSSLLCSPLGSLVSLSLVGESCGAVNP